MLSRRTLFISIGVVAWSLCIVCAFGALAGYMHTPGASRDPDAEANPFLAAHRQAHRPLLVIVVHPRCPCTDASLAEFGDLLARSRGACDAVILRFQAGDWPAGPVSQDCGGVSVPVLPDVDGKIAANLGAETSGDCVLVDADGKIRFHGGITLARGHRGRSHGQDAMLAIIDGRPTALKATPVYGCSIHSKCEIGSTP